MRDALAAAGLADVLGLAGDGVGGDVAAVAVGVGGGDGLLVELGEEDVGDGVVDGLGRVLEEVGEADVEAAFAEADGGVERGEAAETDVEGRHGRAGAEVAVLLFKDGDECGGHFCLKVNMWRCGFARRRVGYSNGFRTTCREDTMEVHELHERLHSWKDFWIDLGTITIGLLIALGLEAGVEQIHHVEQRHELEEELPGRHG